MLQRSFFIHLPDEGTTRLLGRHLGQSCPAGTVLLLSGDLGSGKTTLVQGLGAGLGIVEPISSPTFTLVNEYWEGRIPLYHVDLYRLEPAQAESLELSSYWDGLETTLGVLAIEWSERMTDYPHLAIRLGLENDPNSSVGRRARVTVEVDDQIALFEKVIGDGLLVDEV